MWLALIFWYTWLTYVDLQWEKPSKESEKGYQWIHKMGTNGSIKWVTFGGKFRECFIRFTRWTPTHPFFSDFHKGWFPSPRPCSHEALHDHPGRQLWLNWSLSSATWNSDVLEKVAAEFKETCTNLIRTQAYDRGHYGDINVSRPGI